MKKKNFNLVISPQFAALTIGFFIAVSLGNCGISLAGFTGTLPPKSQAAIEYGFDLMETFDDLGDFTSLDDMSKPNPSSPSTFSAYPPRTGGGASPFNIWAYANTNDNYWIMDHRSDSGYIWDPNNTGSGKSLVMNLKGNSGTKYWGVSLGQGHRDWGYDDIYVFFMAYITSNQWPTGKVNNEWVYEAGHDYSFAASSWKFLTMSTGHKYGWVHGDGTSYPLYVYGTNFNVTHITPQNQSGQNQLEMVSEWGRYFNCDNGNLVNINTVRETVMYSNVGDANNRKIPTDQWIGIEAHYKLGTPGSYDGVQELWWYSADGTPHQVISRHDIMHQLACRGDDKINRIMIGGNNSGTYDWGPTMEPEYWVDDFIVNGIRIGPTYFAMKLAGLNRTPPSPPQNLRKQ